MTGSRGSSSDENVTEAEVKRILDRAAQENGK